MARYRQIESFRSDVANPSSPIFAYYSLSQIMAKNHYHGRGIWTFEQDGIWVNVTYDWKIRADKPLLKALSFIMKPIFSANHRWAMARGEESLKLELARRRASTPHELALIPSPPGAQTTKRRGMNQS